MGGKSKWEEWRGQGEREEVEGNRKWEKCRE